MSRRWLMALAAFLIVGISASCAGTENFQDPDVESDGSEVAFLHFVRSKSVWMAAVSAPIEINGKLIGKIGPGGRLEVEVPASRISIWTNESYMETDVEKGLDYYFEISVPLQDPFRHPVRFEVSAVNPERASELGLAVP